MNDNLFREYPEAKTSMELLRDRRLEELKTWLRANDEDYKTLKINSADKSSALMKLLYDIDKGNVFDEYEDANHEFIFCQEDYIYAQGFFDAWAYLKGLSFPPEDE